METSLPETLILSFHKMIFKKIRIKFVFIIARAMNILFCDNNILKDENNIDLIFKLVLFRHLTTVLGSRTTDRTLLDAKGEKFIAVEDEGTLQIYGQDKRGWTRLTETVERWAATGDNVAYSHTVFNNNNDDDNDNNVKNNNYNQKKEEEHLGARGIEMKKKPFTYEIFLYFSMSKLHFTRQVKLDY